MDDLCSSCTHVEVCRFYHHKEAVIMKQIIELEKYKAVMQVTHTAGSTQFMKDYPTTKCSKYEEKKNGTL